MRGAQVFGRLFASLAVMLMVISCAAPPAATGVVVRLPSDDCAAGAKCSFDFGTISADKIAAFDVVNLGDETAQVAATAVGDVNGDEFELAQGPATTIAPHASSPLAIVAKVPAAGAVSNGLLDVKFKAGDVKGTIDATLSATGAPNPAQTCPNLPSCTFPDTPVGQTASCVAHFHNDSNATETIDDITVQGAGFAFAGFLALPVDIAPLTTLDVTITATPASTGQNDADFSIRCGTGVELGGLVITGT